MCVCAAIIVLIVWVISAISVWLTGICGGSTSDSSGHITGGGFHPRKKQRSPSASATIDFLKQNWKDSLGNCRPCVDWKDIPEKLAYRSSDMFVKTTMHNGQVKLLLTEIEFLTDTLAKDEPAIMVYAGSAPSHKYPFLRAMFPKVKFVMVDPHEHHFLDGNQDQYDSPNDYLYIVAAGKEDVKTGVTHITGMAGENTSTGKMINLLGQGIVQRTTKKQGEIPEDLAQQIENSQQRTIIIEDYMTDHLAALLEPLRSHHKLLFVSDIRTKINESVEMPTDLDIIWNSAMMYNWIVAMKPARYMLKFRTPFGRSSKDKEILAADYAAYPITHQALVSCPIKFIENFQRDPAHFTYLKAEHIWLQAFPGQTSTETRLVGSGTDLVEYDCDEYDDRLFYYNRIYRAFGFHPNARDIVNPAHPTDYCGDCALMQHILETYCKKYSGSPAALIEGILRAIGRNFRGSHHGCCNEKSLDGWIAKLRSLKEDA